MLDETAIQTKLSYAATLMSNRAPILIGFYVMLDKRMTSDRSVTMRVGCNAGKPFIEYGDWFVNMMEPSLLGAVLYANCLRIALHHCDTRVKLPEAMFRLASDLVVYEYARHVVDTTVSDNSAIVAQLFPSIWSYSDKFGAVGFDPVKDLTLEKVFDLLMQTQDQSESEDEDDRESPEGNQDNGGKDKSDQKDQDEQENSESSGQEGESGSEEKEEKDESKGGGGSKESDDPFDEDDTEGDGEDANGSNAPGSGQDEKRESYQAIQQMFDPSSAPQDIQDWGNDQEVADDIRDVASAQFASGQGGVAGNVPLAIQEANRIHVDAAKVFRMFIASNFGAATRQTWSMPNLVLRRFGSIAPGHVRKKDKPKILFAVDVSGSMLSMNLVDRCFQAANNFIGDSLLDMCYWDGVCSEIVRNPRDVFKVDVFGGGMTNPQCVMDRIEAERKNYDGIVFLTDCEFEWECPRNAERVCVVKIGKGSGKVPNWCRWKMEIDDLLRGAA